MSSVMGWLAARVLFLSPADSASRCWPKFLHTIDHVPNETVAHFAIGKRHIDVDGPQRLERKLQVPNAVAERNIFGEDLERFAGRLCFGRPIELLAGGLNFDHVVCGDGVLRIGIGDDCFDTGAKLAVALGRVGGEGWQSGRGNRDQRRRDNKRAKNNESMEHENNRECDGEKYLVKPAISEAQFAVLAAVKQAVNRGVGQSNSGNSL